MAEAGTALSEEAWVKAARGDQTAFAEVVRVHQSRVFSLAFHFLRDRALAEEVAQEVFLDLYRNTAAIKSAAHLTFWLRKVATNRCIDHARRAKSRPQVSLEEIQEPTTPTSQPDCLLSETLRRLVAALPETPRMVVILRYQEDLDPSEIANLLNMSINTVKSHLRRSLSLLREKLSRQVGGPVV
ncbi:MAG TPA: sigma-70 family RNA polymerase sigma factor [Blastocatellia bacterium]|nr:sigma-70 family RNA polymerase sigma factor [Blastocatellia bacterium]